MSTLSVHPSICVVGGAGLMGHGLLTRLIASVPEASTTLQLHAVDISNERLHAAWTSTTVNNTSDGVRLHVHDAIADGIAASDVVILAIPYGSEQLLNADAMQAMRNKIVVSITNPLTATLDDVLTPHDQSAAESLAAVLPGSRIVKALNTISASALLLPREVTVHYDTFVASDDEDAALVIENIVRLLGFRPWYVGRLKLSRTLERMTALLIGISQRYALTGPLGWNVQGAQPD